MEIEGSAEALHQLAVKLADPGGATYSLRVPSDATTALYDGFLTSIVLILANDLLKVQRQVTSLVITGPVYQRQVLAQNISSLAEQGRGKGAKKLGMHIHVEYFPDHFYLDPASEPLVISLNEDTNGF